MISRLAICLAAFSALLVLAQSATADQPKNAPTPMPTPTVSPTPTPSPTPSPILPVHMIREPGHPVRFLTSDGREAELSITRRPAAVGVIPFGLSETTCAIPEGATLKCEFTVPVREQTFHVRWTKNPDASKIGQLVNYGGSIPVEDEALTSVKQQLEGEADAKEMTRLKLRCDDFTWLTGTKDAPATFSLAEMAGERMLSNPETGAPENETFVGHYELEFARLSDREIELVKSGAWFSLIDPDVRTWLLGSDIIQMTSVTTPPQPACQTAVKPDLTLFGQLRDAYEKKYSTEEPYLEGSDETFDMLLNNDRSLFGFVIRGSEDNWK